MINKNDLDLMEELSPVLKDFMSTVINEGVDSMVDIIGNDEEDYIKVFTELKTSEAQDMLIFLESVALPFYTEREKYEYSAKCKRIIDLIRKYKNLKEN